MDDLQVSMEDDPLMGDVTCLEKQISAWMALLIWVELRRMILFCLIPLLLRFVVCFFFIYNSVSPVCNP